MAKAQKLARGGPVPPNVQETIRFLTDIGIWFKLSRKRPSDGCADAASKRRRSGPDGKVGIPLFQEQKTLAFKLRTPTGKINVLLHGRGDRIFDFRTVATELDALDKMYVIPPKQLRALGMGGRGLVNPFRHWEEITSTPVIQVFDNDLVKRMGTPSTVMTNAGDLTWGVEFFADELAQKVNGICADIANPDPEHPRPEYLVSPLRIGVIGGNPPESATLFINRLTDAIRILEGANNFGGLSPPPLSYRQLVSLDLTMEIDEREEMIWAELEPLLEELCPQIDVLTIPCNTTPYFDPEIHEICEKHGVTYISMPQVVGHYLRTSGVKEVAIIGIKPVVQIDKGWSAYESALEGIDVEVPSDYIIKRLTTLANLVKEKGATRERLNDVRDALQAVETGTVILALTELSQVFTLQPTSQRVLIDPVELYATATGRAWMGAGRTTDRAVEIGGNTLDLKT